MLTIFDTLESRSRDSPEEFQQIQLTLLGEVAQNGVQTISSVQGEGMELCEQAMTTLLKGYMANEPPTSWKKLFKEATNIGFMVKYMFREDLKLAKTKFVDFAGDKSNFKKLSSPSDTQELFKRLVDDTLASYGEVDHIRQPTP